MKNIMKKITTKRVLLFLLLLIKLAIFPHIGILFIAAAAYATEPYRLVIVAEPDRLNRSFRPVGHKDEFYRIVCGTQEALAWGEKTVFKGRPWHPVIKSSPAEVDYYTSKVLLHYSTPDGPCDSKIVGTYEEVVTVGKNSDRMCPRVEGCVINLDALSEEEYCPTCMWKKL
jgi:hypothetical protein